MANAVLETVASRYNRDWKQIKDARKIRGLDKMHAGRRNRNYVPPETVTRDANGRVTGYTSVVVVGDNTNGFTVPVKHDPNA